METLILLGDNVHYFHTVLGEGLRKEAFPGFPGAQEIPADAIATG